MLGLGELREKKLLEPHGVRGLRAGVFHENPRHVVFVTQDSGKFQGIYGLHNFVDGDPEAV